LCVFRARFSQARSYSARGRDLYSLAHLLPGPPAHQRHRLRDAVQLPTRCALRHKTRCAPSSALQLSANRGARCQYSRQTTQLWRCPGADARAEAVAWTRLQQRYSLLRSAAAARLTQRLRLHHSGQGCSAGATALRNLRVLGPSAGAPHRRSAALAERSTAQGEVQLLRARYRALGLDHFAEHDAIKCESEAALIQPSEHLSCMLSSV
jgi:hypothetical protein